MKYKRTYFCTECSQELDRKEVKRVTVDSSSIPGLGSMDTVEDRCSKGHVVWNYTNEQLLEVKEKATAAKR